MIIFMLLLLFSCNNNHADEIAETKQVTTNEPKLEIANELTVPGL